MVQMLIHSSNASRVATPYLTATQAATSPLSSITLHQQPPTSFIMPPHSSPPSIPTREPLPIPNSNRSSPVKTTTSDWSRITCRVSSSCSRNWSVRQPVARGRPSTERNKRKYSCRRGCRSWGNRISRWVRRSCSPLFRHSNRRKTWMTRNCQRLPLGA